MPKLGTEYIAFQSLTGRPSSGCLKVLSFGGLGDRFSIYFELLTCTTGSACSMICICFSHDVIISHHLSLRRITAIIMTTHSQAPAKHSNRARSLPVHTKPEVTWKGLPGTPGPSGTLFPCSTEDMGKSTKPRKTRNKHAVCVPGRVWGEQERGASPGHCTAQASAFHSRSSTEMAPVLRLP